MEKNFVVVVVVFFRSFRFIIHTLTADRCNLWNVWFIF